VLTPPPHPRRLAPSKQWTVFRSKGNTERQSEESNWHTNENTRIRHKRCLERGEPKILLKADFDFLPIPLGKMAVASSVMAKGETKRDTDISSGTKMEADPCVGSLACAREEGEGGRFLSGKLGEYKKNGEILGFKKHRDPTLTLGAKQKLFCVISSRKFSDRRSPIVPFRDKKKYDARVKNAPDTNPTS